MLISYISTSNFPTQQANLVNVMSMCYSLIKNQNKLYLFLKTKSYQKNSILKKQLIKDFGLTRINNIILFKFINIYGMSVFYSLFCSIKTFFLNVSFCFSRDPIAAYFCSILRIPVVLELHAPINKLPKIEMFFLKKLIKNKHFLFFIVITDFLKKNFLSYNIDKSRIIVLPDGANIPKKEIKKVNLRGNYDKELFYVGSLYKGRGIDLILKLSKIMPSKRFHIVGGSLKEVTYYKSKTSGQKNIIFYGYVPFNKTKSFIKSADILLAPYQKTVNIYGGGNTVEWMSPLKIFEYMSFRKPIIASKLSSLQIVLKHRYNSYLVEPDNIYAWKKAIITLEKDKLLSNKISKMAFNDLKSKYSWDIRSKLVIKKIKEIKNYEFY